LGGDLLAGVTLAAMLIPQSVSYGITLAKLNPASGLVRLLGSFLITCFHVHFSTQFAASIPPIMYSLLGTSRQLNVAPEAALSLLVGQAVSDYRLHSPPEDADIVGIAVSTAITFQVTKF